jgi:flagellin-like hook-associated protein FlgL
MSPHIASMRNARLQATNYHRMRIRTDPTVSVSSIGNGPDNVAGRTARAAWADHYGDLTNAITNTEDKIAAYETATTGLDSLAAKLAEMKSIVDQANDETLTPAELQTLQDQYDVLYDEFSDLLTDPAHNGTQLLTGRSPLVTLNVAALADVDLVNDVEGGVLAVSAAMTDVDVASGTAELDLADLQAELTVIEGQVDDYANYETTLDTIEAAAAALDSVSVSLMATLTEVLSAQSSDVDPIRAMILLAETSSDTDSSPEGPAA